MDRSRERDHSATSAEGAKKGVRNGGVTTRIAGVACAAGLGLCVAPAQAGYVVTLTQEGTDVVATGSGPIDLTAWIYQVSAQDRGVLVPNSATIITGPLSPRRLLHRAHRTDQFRDRVRSRR